MFKGIMIAFLVFGVLFSIGDDDTRKMGDNIYLFVIACTLIRTLL